jgi:hypothetical protein
MATGGKRIAGVQISRLSGDVRKAGREREREIEDDRVIRSAVDTVLHIQYTGIVSFLVHFEHIGRLSWSRESEDCLIFNIVCASM